MTEEEEFQAWLADDEQREALLGKRLGLPVPAERTPSPMRRWYDEIGYALLLAQPEFRQHKHPGRPFGTTKGLPLWDDPTANYDAMKMRRRRARQKLKELSAALDQQRQALNKALDQRLRELRNAIELMRLLYPDSLRLS
jgi:hypothetical protein